MNRRETSWFSNRLNRDMHILVYGDGGYPLLVFQTQNSKCGNYEDFGMIDTLADYIDGGRIQVFCVDSVDEDSWSNESGDKAWRAWYQESYYHYIIEEVLPFIHGENHSDRRPIATGCSMGATHAAIVCLRRPDLFEGMIALSGVYDARYFFGGWMNSTLYDNSPVDFIAGMPADHPYVALYNSRKYIFCVGQGAWEEEGIQTQRVLDACFRAKGIQIWCDFWGYDVNHDWPWWKKQIRYFLPIVLEHCGA